MIYPPRIQIKAWSASNKSPQTHTVGMSLNSQPYLDLIASLNSLLLRVKFISFKGITLSQLEAPFSFINSTARTVSFLLTHASLRVSDILIVRCLYCLHDNLFHKGCGCFDGRLIFLSRLVYGIYQTKARLMRTGNARRSRSVSVTWCSKRDGIRTSEMARSKGFSKSVMSGSVLKKYVHR